MIGKNNSFSLLNPLSWVSWISGFDPSTSIQELSVSNTNLMRLQQSFFHWAGKEGQEVNILSFIEQRKEAYLNKLVVKEQSARLLLPREEEVKLPFSHSE